MEERAVDYYEACIEAGICPDCGAELVNEGGCAHCQKCGFSACSND